MADEDSAALNTAPESVGRSAAKRGKFDGRIAERRRGGKRRPRPPAGAAADFAACARPCGVRGPCGCPTEVPRVLRGFASRLAYQIFDEATNGSTRRERPTGGAGGAPFLDRKVCPIVDLSHLLKITSAFSRGLLRMTDTTDVASKARDVSPATHEV